MKFDDLDKIMRSHEIFHEFKINKENWVILRVDGRAFSTFTTEFEKPYDHKFHDAMVSATKALMEDFKGIYACTHSDEISILLPKPASQFNGKIEKLVSVAASIASSEITYRFKRRVSFDGRIWTSNYDEDVVDYFRWRSADAERCAANGWTYWTLRKSGMNEHQAASTINKKNHDFKIDLLRQHGVDFFRTEPWQRYGTGLYWETYQKDGYNPKTQQKTTVERRRIKIDEDLPISGMRIKGDKYSKMILELMQHNQ